MAFNREEANALLVACHRRCCICHRLCGIKIELHHIEPRRDGGPDAITNAIPVCFECHAEIQLYNNAHPRGRKFHPNELHAHREQWLQICRESPEMLLSPQWREDVGPIQALVDELDFNAVLARRDSEDIGALFLVSQFERAIHEGVFALLPDSVRSQVSAAYIALMRANASLGKMAMMPWGGSGSAWSHAFDDARRAITSAQSEVTAAREALLRQLGHSETEN